MLMATDQKWQRKYYPPSHCLNVNVMLSNIALFDFCCFDPSQLTVLINCCFRTFISAVLLPISVFFILHFQEI